MDKQGRIYTHIEGDEDKSPRTGGNRDMRIRAKQASSQKPNSKKSAKPFMNQDIMYMTQYDRNTEL